MSFDAISANQGALFDAFPESESPASRVRSPRSANRAAAWERDLAQSVSYLMGQCHSADEREFVSRLYDEAAERGPDFIHYRSNSAFQAAPRLGIDRNAYARILNALEAIERGTYRHSREKGKQGIPRTVARVLKALFNLALQYGEVRPSLEGLGKLACVCKQTVVNCLKILQLYGFVVVHRRIKRIRMLLVARSQLVGQRQSIANTIRGLMKTFGISIPRGCGGLFATRVREAGDGNDVLMAIVEPMLVAWQALREQVLVFDRRIIARAKADKVAQRLMTVPGVGVVVALAYAAVIDDPARFRHSASVGAYLGLTPRRFQSGEIDVSGRISRCGDGLLRSYLFEAATVILQRYSRASGLKAWGLALAKRIGMRRAKVAVARKLAVLMHRMWVDETEFKGGADALAA